MASRRNCGVWGKALLGLIGLFVGISLAGCSRGGSQQAKDESPQASPANAAEGAGSTKSAGTAGDKQAPTDPAYANLHQPFADATFDLAPEDKEDWHLLDSTMTGKSIGKTYKEVTERWDTIKFLTAAGKPI